MAVAETVRESIPFVDVEIPDDARSALSAFRKRLVAGIKRLAIALWVVGWFVAWSYVAYLNVRRGRIDGVVLTGITAVLPALFLWWYRNTSIGPRQVPTEG